MLSLSSHPDVKPLETLKVLARYKSEDTERIACLFMSSTCGDICGNRGWSIELQTKQVPHIISIGFENSDDAVTFKLMEDLPYLQN